MRVNIAEVVQVDYGVRLVGQSQNLGNSSRQRCLSRALAVREGLTPRHQAQPQFSDGRDEARLFPAGAT